MQALDETLPGAIRWGEIKITHQLTGPFFRPIGNDSPVTFFVLPGLTAFHGIIGDDTLKSFKAVIDRKK